jgi:LmbE family N-acetylglucosaminyl deacetylase
LSPPAAEPQAAQEDSLTKNWKILSLFKIMEIQGLQDIHEETLREINHTLVELIRQEPPERGKLSPNRSPVHPDHRSRSF